MCFWGIAPPGDLSSMLDEILDDTPGTMTTKSIGEVLGIDNEAEHTALSDAFWVYRCFREVTGLDRMTGQRRRVDA